MKHRLRRINRRLREEIDIDIHQKPLISKKNSKIFTIGSCFAIELRKYFRKQNYHVLEVEDESKATSRSALAWYNTYSIKYEFELAARGEFHRGPEDYWEGNSKGWQDAIRRLQFGETKEKLIEKINHTNQKIITGIREADVVIITLGLCEAWRCPTGERHIQCAAPKYHRGGSYKKPEYEFVDYNQNMINLSACMAYLLEINEKAQVIMSVSPVPLAATWRKDHEHFVANCESKSCLRAVAGRMEKSYENLTYFPSYEIVTSQPRKQAFSIDGRHVNSTCVANIMRKFELTHVKEFTDINNPK